MAVPVQTWGSLGNMVQEQREFGNESADYLESQEVYDLFGHLLRQVVIQQPDDPIKFLQEQLKSKPPLTLCVMGPPGVNRSKYSERLAAEYKITHIHVGKLLGAKPELQAAIKAGALVDDDVVIAAVQAEIKGCKGGYVLDGFPRSKIQAMSLSRREVGFGLDKVLLLHTAEEAIRASYASKAAAAGLDGDVDDIVNTRLQQYHRHIVTICELFKNVVRQISVSPGGEAIDETVYSIIKNNLHVRLHSNASLRSHRVAVLGPCASGRTTQCKLVAKQYGLVHVDPAALLKQHQEASGKVVEEVPPEWVSDEELCGVVGRRLQEVDCVRKGWVLDGFPKTVAQAEFLRQSHLWPSRMVHLKTSADTIAKRMDQRKVDPVTATAYYETPADELVAARLIKADYDAAEKVQRRISLHEENVATVMQVFSKVGSEVDGADDELTLANKVREKIDAPLQTELSQDPQN